MGAWVIVWRLRVLYKRRQLTYQSSHKYGLNRTRYRICCACLGLFAFLIADLPLCRLNYNFQLKMFITPKKEAILSVLSPACQEAYMNTELGQDGECRDVCAAARE